jgi:uncharacterized phage-associated protein
MSTHPLKISGYSAQEVAKYFIYLASQKVVGDNQEREGLTNLKLQKILYFAQAYYLAKLGKPLFQDSIEAWEYGPVVPEVYHKFKKHKSDPIIEEKDKSKISPEDKEYLNKIWESFGGYSTSRLIDISHAHTPWKVAYKNTNKQITLEALSDYYTPLLNK